MKEIVSREQGLQELSQIELKELRGGNPIINFLLDLFKGYVWDYIFSPDQGSHTSHPGAPRNPDGIYICVSDNA